MNKRLWLAGVLAAIGPFVGQLPQAAAQEVPAEIIAAHIRTQGFACSSPKGAQHDVGLSRPNEQVWTLECENATYRVRLIPNLAAQVERIQ